MAGLDEQRGGAEVQILENKVNVGDSIGIGGRIDVAGVGFAGGDAATYLGADGGTVFIVNLYADDDRTRVGAGRRRPTFQCRSPRASTYVTIKVIMGYITIEGFR